MGEVISSLMVTLVAIAIFGSPIWLILYFMYRNKKQAREFYGMSVLDLGRAVFVMNGEAVECDNLTLDATRNGFVLTSAGTSRLVRFDSFKSIFTRLNLRNPVVHMRTQDGLKAAVYFTSSPQSIRALNANLATTFAFGEAISGAIMAKSPGALGASYGQILKDRVSLTENWLIYHKISAYTSKFDRGTRMAFILGSPVLVFIIALLVFMVKESF